MRKVSSLSVVIPVHNEESTIASVIEEILTFGRNYGVKELEIIVVDDASDDGSASVAAAYSPIVKLIRADVRHGSGHSRRTGSLAAIHEWVAWIDGDGTYSALDFAQMVSVCGEADQIVGRRCEDFGRYLPLRRAVKRFNNMIASTLWGRRINDLNSGLRLFRRDALGAFIDELPEGFSCTSTSTLASLSLGHRLMEVPVSYRPRPAGSQSKFNPVWDTLRLWRVIIVQYLRRGKHQRSGAGLAAMETQ